MNEFIVWDKKEKKFINENMAGEMVAEFGLCENEHIKVCLGIGLKDMNNNNIYADSSIVEFEHRMHGKCKGVFSYSNTELAYLIKLISVDDFTFADKTRINYDVMYVSDISIIDTIQENKLGLFDNKEN